jgi:hypothetical protein
MKADCKRSGLGGIPYNSDVNAYRSIPLVARIIREEAKKFIIDEKIVFLSL